MFAQVVPIGVKFTSPLTWFVVAIACIVLALTFSTRRGNAGSRSSAAQAAPPSTTADGTTEHYAAEWAVAQALFVDDPRAGLLRAQGIVTRALRDRAEASVSDRLQDRYRVACTIAEDAQATTEQLRQAFVSLREILAGLNSARQA